ncbi:hypothetical protein HRbin36_02892 [bacterium HR36]|nr:hypothetical protein HRbin36_02892 [bacterium HR36]
MPEIALKCVADGPPDWLREARGISGPVLEPLLRHVDAVAYVLSRVFRHLEKLAHREREYINHQDLVRDLKEHQEKIREFIKRKWGVCGAFIEQAEFRLRALDFYRNLDRLAEEQNWPDSDRQQIQERLRAYEERYRRWQEQQKGREVREDVVYVNPGQRRGSRWLEVNSLSERREAVLSVLPDLYQVRFQPPTEPDGQPYIHTAPELRLTGPDVVERSLIYRIIYKDRTITLEWHKDNRTLYVRGDLQFVVVFAVSGPSAAPGP